MKKYLLMVLCLVLLLSAAGCGKTQEVASVNDEDVDYYVDSDATLDVTTDMDNSFSAEDIYAEFIASKEWAKDDIYAVLPYNETLMEIGDYTIIDFDNDGISELWIDVLDNDSFEFTHGLSAFYTLEGDKVVPVLICNSPGERISGEWISMYYDSLTQRHIIEKGGVFLDENGDYEYSSTYYDYSKGVLDEIIGLYLTGDGTYFINERIVTEEEYEDVKGRFVDPIDWKYSLY